MLKHAAHTIHPGGAATAKRVAAMHQARRLAFAGPVDGVSGSLHGPLEGSNGANTLLQGTR